MRSHRMELQAVRRAAGSRSTYGGGGPVVRVHHRIPFVYPLGDPRQVEGFRSWGHSIAGD